MLQRWTSAHLGPILQAVTRAGYLSALRSPPMYMIKSAQAGRALGALQEPANLRATLSKRKFNRLLGKPASYVRALASPREAITHMSDIQNAVVDIVRVNMFDLDSNYGWLIRDKSTGKVAAIDPAQPDAIQHALKAKSWSLDYILNTHHHHDHVGGNSYLKSAYDCTIIGFSEDAQRIPLMDTGVAEGDTVQVGSLAFRVFEVPGHTRGHIAFWEESAAALFPGDTLFAMGCGRLFEGTPQQMWNSLKKFKSLPGNTLVFCAHEYTQNNARWAVTVEPDNQDLADRKTQVDLMRSRGTPTIPTTISDELKTNPFLRPDSLCIRRTLGVASDASDETAFAAIRKHKDTS